jgi:glycogen debranching enzyme
MNEELVQILDGNTFVVSDDRGDVVPNATVPTGLFSYDTRFLSTWVLTVDGERLQSLAVDDLHYFEARFFLVPGSGALYPTSRISVIRHRWVHTDLEERLTVINYDRKTVRLRLRLEAGCDFADLFEVKDEVRKLGTSFAEVQEGTLILGYRRGNFRRQTVIRPEAATHVDDCGIDYDVELAPQQSWETGVRVEPRVLTRANNDVRAQLKGHNGPRREPQRTLDEWVARAPRLRADRRQLENTYRRSIVDLAALRFAPLTAPDSGLPAAGLPWFMSIFGRDSIFTSLQALPFLPELALATLSLLGHLQGSRIDDFREEEPGKILHEFRYGESAAFEEQPHSPYFGSADTTPLYIVLLDEYHRWTGDDRLVMMLEARARAALQWIDEYADLMGNRYVAYHKRNDKTGLDNQCWKDSWDSISYHDGRLPGPARATCELQGYAYDAKRRGARLARELWHDQGLAERLEREAADLKRRFNRDFWVADGGYFALALEPDGSPVDALASNIGHLLWSGIVDNDRVQAVVDHLMGPRLFSGWGVRTLAAGEGRYNPVGYHTGTVWPFDNSIIAWGLRQYGYKEEAARVAQGILEAAEYFDGRLPEAFAGYDRDLTRYPVEYPTACSPQAWSTGAPLLLLRTMLGLEPLGEHLTVDPVLPPNIGWIGLLEIPGRWGRFDAFGRGRGAATVPVLSRFACDPRGIPG